MEMNTLSTRSKRLLAMVWFCGFAFLSVSLFFYPLSMTLQARLLYAALPTLSGGIAGYTLGADIIDPTKTGGYGKAIIRGIGVALAAFAIFAGLFALSVPLAEPLWGINHVGGLFLGTLMFGFIMGGPLVVVAGSVAGATLHWFGRHR